MKSEETYFEYKRKLLSCDGDMQRMASVLLAAKSDLRINRYEYLGLVGFAKELDGVIMSGATYWEYRRKLSAPDLSREELVAILDDAAENPLITTVQLESLWFFVSVQLGVTL